MKSGILADGFKHVEVATKDRSREDSNMNKLVYQTSPRVTFASNVFIDVPVVLQFDETPLISIVREEELGYTTEIPVYHSDGTYLAKVRGTRIFPTDAGKKAGLELRYPKHMTVCELAGRTVFEIFHEPGDAFRTHAELHTPSGYFVKSHDGPLPDLISATGDALRVGGVHMSGNLVSGFRIGVWLKSDGSIAIGCK